MEILDVSDHLGHTGDYEIRKMRMGASYVLLDVLGDFVIIEEDEVDNIFSIIYNDTQGGVSLQ
jgi:hypothetical protein